MNSVRFQKKGFIEVDGVPIAALLVYELRQDIKMSFSPTGLRLRLPLNTPMETEREWVDKMQVWADNVLKNNDELRHRVLGRTYTDGMVLRVYNRAYHIKVSYEERDTHHAILTGQQLQLILSKRDTPAHLRKSKSQLVSRCIGNDCLNEFSARVHQLNELHFRHKIKSIAFKLNQSNWGSCSNTHRLNFSTRLLFAPEEVIDYVIIHELAHISVFNHSDAFWKVVERIVPNYEVHEAWLKKKGYTCVF